MAGRVAEQKEAAVNMTLLVVRIVAVVVMKQSAWLVMSRLVIG